MQCLDEKWEFLPEYNINNYKRHYFYKDFDKLKARFIEEHEEARNKRRKAEKQGGLEIEKGENVKQKEIRDFVPVKVAIRIRDFI